MVDFGVKLAANLIGIIGPWSFYVNYFLYLISFGKKVRLYVQEILDSGFERERIIEINVI